MVKVESFASQKPQQTIYSTLLLCNYQFKAILNKKRLKSNYLLLHIFIFINCNYVLAQSKFNSSALQEDMNVLKEITIELSPKLTNKDRLRIDHQAQIIKAELEGKSLTAMEFFDFLTKIDFQTKFDAHASLSITEEVLMPLLTSSKLFPLPFKIISGSMVVVNSVETELPYGSIIRSINGIRLDSLLKSFTEDYEDTFVKRRLENQFSIIYLIKKGRFQTYQVEYSPPSEPSNYLEETIAGIDFDRYQEIFAKTVYPLNRSNLSNLINSHYHQKDYTYYLQLNSFNWNTNSEKGFFTFLNSDRKNFDRRFKSIFKEIAKYKAANLIIDLRFNKGGNVKVPGTLFKYIAQNEYTENIRVEIEDFDIPKIDLITRIDGKKIKGPNKVKSFVRMYKIRFNNENDTSYVWPIVENKVTKPSKHAFKGNVYLLVGGQSVSASAYFAALFKCEKRGTIVGEEMGGSYQSLTAGKMLTYQLPNTRLELTVPIMLVNFSDQLYQIIGMDRIIPDFLFDDNENYKYLLEKKDIEIEKVIEKINENDLK